MEEVKRCSVCKETKQIDAFNWRNKSKGIRRSECRECQSKDSRQYYYDRGGNKKHTQTYIKNREKRISYNKEYLKRVGYAPRKYDPIKSPARIAVYRAIQSGKLTRPDKCDKCGKECNPQAHHHNGYDKAHRLDVVWLCTGCHAMAENPIYMSLMEESNVVSESYPNRQSR